jgi:hypothetical protein
MKTFFVIRELASGNYLSIYDTFDDTLTLCKFLDSEESAIEELEKLNGYFVIEKVYNP